MLKRSAYSRHPANAVNGTRMKSMGTTTVASACRSARAEQSWERVPPKATMMIHGHATAAGHLQTASAGAKPRMDCSTSIQKMMAIGFSVPVRTSP
jgi:hypothetical protein